MVKISMTLHKAGWVKTLKHLQQDTDTCGVLSPSKRVHKDEREMVLNEVKSYLLCVWLISWRWMLMNTWPCLTGNREGTRVTHLDSTVHWQIDAGCSPLTHPAVIFASQIGIGFSTQFTVVGISAIYRIYNFNLNVLLGAVKVAYRLPYITFYWPLLLKSWLVC